MGSFLSILKCIRRLLTCDSSIGLFIDRARFRGCASSVESFYLAVTRSFTGFYFIVLFLICAFIILSSHAYPQIYLEADYRNSYKNIICYTMKKNHRSNNLDAGVDLTSITYASCMTSFLMAEQIGGCFIICTISILFSILEKPQTRAVHTFF